MFTTKSLITMIAASGLAMAAPTATTGGNTPSVVERDPKITHSVTVGIGLTYSPDNIVAKQGEIVEFHFKARNHTVTQSSFDNPCQPLDNANGGFNSGFQFVPEPNTQGPNVFQITVTDATKPLWFYCAQTTGNHCQSGMSGVINQNFDSPKNLRAYKENSKKAVTVAQGAVSAGSVYGAVIPNPFPDRGF